MLFFVLAVKVQYLTIFSIFRGIKLKFDRAVNFEMLISYFKPILTNSMSLIKNEVSVVIVIDFMQRLFNKRVAMVT